MKKVELRRYHLKYEAGRQKGQWALGKTSRGCSGPVAGECLECLVSSLAQ